ncbi:MAG: SDR family oxidoreductase [Gemmatimonadales bacterium]|nr:SDR family oxidoreductase [Gemmatimonadales bacterium]
MRILILGGTGFIGPYQVRYAVERGHRVTIFNRGRTNPDLFPGVEQLIGDRDGKLDALKGKSWDAVIDNSGYVPRHVRDSAQLLKGNVGQYLFVSTAGIYDAWYSGKWPAGGVGEDAPQSPLTEPGSEDTRKHYGPLKALCEKAVLESYPGNATLVRPGLIVGPGDPTDRFTYFPVRIDRGGEVPVPGTPSDPVLYIDARDLSEWCVRLVENKVTGPYNALGPLETFTMAEMIYGCRAVTSSAVKLTWVDGAIVNQQGINPLGLFPWFWTEGPFAQASHFKRDRAFAAGLTFRPFADTARDTLHWFKTLPAARQAKLLAGLTAEQEQKLLAAAHARSTKK